MNSNESSSSSMELEQQFHDLEKRYVSLKSEYDLCRAENTAHAVKIKALQSVADQSALQASVSDRRVIELTYENEQKDKLVHDLQMGQEELNDRYKRRSDECDRLRDDLKSQVAELLTLQLRLKDAQLNLSEFQSVQLPTQYELTKALHEKELLGQQVQYLQEELQKKLREERQLRAEHVDRIQQLETALSASTSEAQDGTKQIGTLKDQAHDQQEKLSFYMNKLKEAEAALVEKQGAFSHEVEGLKRLNELYKRYLEDATAKVDDLEKRESITKSTHADLLSTLKERISILAEHSENAVKAEEEKWSGEVAALKTQLQELQERQAVVVVPSIVDNSTTAAVASMHASNYERAIQNYDMLGMTEMYDRIVQMDRELFAERSKRKEVEMYLQQILKDVESKAPILASQRRDYYRIIESHASLANRLDLLVQENSDLKHAVDALRRDSSEAREESQALSIHNSDLCQQVQHLLRMSLDIGRRSTHSNDGVAVGSRRAVVEATDDEEEEGGINPQDVISEYLVTFDDVVDLQRKNAELLRVVRKLSKEPALMLLGDGDGDSTTASSANASSASAQKESSNSRALQAAMGELSEMREARQRMEEMVVVLAQQRDMYRSMVEGEPNLFPQSNLLRSPGSAPLDMQAVGSSALNSNSSGALGAISLRELQAKLAQAEEEKKRLVDRMARLEEVEAMLNQSLDAVRKEATTARIEGAQASSEARYQKERAERLQGMLDTAQQESTSALQRRLSIEKNLLDSHQALRSKDDRIADLQETLRMSQDAQRRAEIEAEVAKGSEGRLIIQLSEAREETKRHVNLVEQLHRIESGLQSRVEAEKEALVHDKSVLQNSFEALRKQLDERNLMDEQRSKVTEDELRLLRNRLEQKTTEVSSLSEQLGRDQVLVQASQDRCNLLEKQLNIAQDRIAQIQGTQIIDSSIANDITVKELALEKALSEIEALKHQLTSSEVHADQFRKISVANETALKDIRTRAEAMQTAQEAELLRMRTELETAVQEVTEQRASCQRFLQDSEQAREELHAFRSESAVMVRRLEESLALSQQEVLQMNEQSLAVATEIAKYQEAARLAHQNYERELQMHAQAERDLSDMRKQLDDTLSSLRKEQQRSAELSSECIRKELLLQDEKSRSSQESLQIRELLSGLQGTNDLLHAQVQSYGAQIEKLQTQRLHSSLSPSTAGITSSSTIAMTIVSDTSSSAVEETKSQLLPVEGVEGNGSSVSIPTVAADTVISQSTQPLPPANKADVDELVELRKTSVELREVLRFMKREKDMLTAKLSVSEMEAGRLASELQSLRRSLDEVKIELKKELDKRVTIQSPEEFNKLMSEVSQLNIIRESNAHLRSENESLSQKMDSLTAQLRSAVSASSPLEEMIRKLRAEKESVEAVNTQLNVDVNYWRNRLQTLVSRYNDVDPEEHRLLKRNVEELTAALSSVQQSLEQQSKLLEETTQAHQLLLVSKDKEIDGLKNQVSLIEETGEKLRISFRTVKQKLEVQLATSNVTMVEKEGQLVKANEEMAVLKATIDTMKATQERLETERAAAELRSKASSHPPPPPPHHHHPDTLEATSVAQQSSSAPPPQPNARPPPPPAPSAVANNTATTVSAAAAAVVDAPAVAPTAASAPSAVVDASSTPSTLQASPLPVSAMVEKKSTNMEAMLEKLAKKAAEAISAGTATGTIMTATVPVPASTAATTVTPATEATPVPVIATVSVPASAPLAVASAPPVTATTTTAPATTAPTATTVVSVTGKRPATRTTVDPSAPAPAAGVNLPPTKNKGKKPRVAAATAAAAGNTPTAATSANKALASNKPVASIISAVVVPPTTATTTATDSSSDAVAMDTTGEMNVEQGGGNSFAPVEESSALLPNDGGVVPASSSVAVAVIHTEEEAMQISSSDDVIPTDSIAVHEKESIPMSINPSEVEVTAAVSITTSSSSSSSTGSNLLGNSSDETKATAPVSTASDDTSSSSSSSSSAVSSSNGLEDGEEAEQQSSSIVVASKVAEGSGNSFMSSTSNTGSSLIGGIFGSSPITSNSQNPWQQQPKADAVAVAGSAGSVTTTTTNNNISFIGSMKQPSVSTFGMAFNASGSSSFGAAAAGASKFPSTSLFGIVASGPVPSGLIASTLSSTLTSTNILSSVGTSGVIAGPFTSSSSSPFIPTTTSIPTTAIGAVSTGTTVTAANPNPFTLFAATPTIGTFSSPPPATASDLTIAAPVPFGSSTSIPGPFTTSTTSSALSTPAPPLGAPPASAKDPLVEKKKLELRAMRFGGVGGQQQQQQEETE